MANRLRQKMKNGLDMYLKLLLQFPPLSKVLPHLYLIKITSLMLYSPTHHITITSIMLNYPISFTFGLREQLEIYIQNFSLLL